jgi:hypothetical protein
MRHLWVVSIGLAAALSLAGAGGCSSGGGGMAASGGSGTSQTGGAVGSGGATGSGGKGSGGSSAQTGGTTGSGGVSASGGSKMTASGGAPGSGGGAATGSGGTTGGSGGNAGNAGMTGSTGSGGAGQAGAGTATGGRAGSNGSGGAAGASSTGGGAGGATSADCSSAGAVITFPAQSNATKSPLYTVTANGTSQFVEKMTRFNKEMQVHYAYFGLASGCKASIAVTVGESFNSYTVSPKSRNLTATKSGNTITFSSGPNYLILQFDSKELLFILIDDQEANPPQLTDANVKSIADYSVDNTGATVVTSKVQSAINAASGATQNILYFPPGRYKVGELSLKSNMTLYLAGGAMLDGSTSTSDYAAAGPDVESTTHGLIHLNNVSNTNILGRGVIDAEGTVITAGSNDTPSFKINAVRVDKSSKVLIDGVLVRDSVFWNTLVYTSDQITLQNYKVINRRPITTTYNQTDGVDFDASTNCTLSNAFLYTGDDNMSPKAEQEGGIDTKNITFQHVVTYSNSGACKVGTKTFGTTMSGLVFKDIDIVKAGRAFAMDANDTAVVQNTTFQDVRIEAADSNLIDIEEDMAPTWRTAPNTSTVKDVYFTNISSNVKQLINIHGKSSTVNVNGVHFDNFTVQGKKLTSQTDSAASWNINQYVSNITFQ